MRSPRSMYVACWRGVALLALVFGLLLSLWDPEAAARSGAESGVTVMADEPGGGLPSGEATARQHLRLGGVRGWPWESDASWAITLRGDAGGKKVQIRHPRKDKDLLPIFVAAVHVAANKKDVNLADVTAKLVDKNNLTPTGAKLRPLKVTGHQKANNSRLFVLVEAKTPGTNPHTLTIGVKLMGNVKKDSQTFNIKSHEANKVAQPGGRKRGRYFIDLYYPANNHIIEGYEREYFVPCGPSSSPIDDDEAKVGGVKGTPHWNNDDPADPIWWVEFFGLSINPGPGTGYYLEVTNDENEEIDQTTVDVADQ